MSIIKLSDIKISEDFANSVPTDIKVQECRDNWNKWHRQDRYVVVNHENVLIDGYIMYLVLKENGIEEVCVKISDICKKRWKRRRWNVPNYIDELTSYIYGIHPNSKNKKELVWRVPKTWSEFGWEDGLAVGDEILVTTKFGIKPIVITKIEKLDKCPVNMPVKKVVKRVVKD